MWQELGVDYYLGTYGSKKHELMIQWTGKTWDDAYFKTLAHDCLLGSHDATNNQHIR